MNWSGPCAVCAWELTAGALLVFTFIRRIELPIHAVCILPCISIFCAFLAPLLATLQHVDAPLRHLISARRSTWHGALYRPGNYRSRGVACVRVGGNPVKRPAAFISRTTCFARRKARRLFVSTSRRRRQDSTVLARDPQRRIRSDSSGISMCRQICSWTRFMNGQR